MSAPLPFAHPAATLRAGAALYTPTDLLNPPPSDTDPLLADAWAFCRAWLRGEERFELQTSGSTGAPKPVELTRRQMEASARATAAALRLQPGDRSLACLPTRFIAGRMMLVRGLVLGLQSTLVAPAADPLADLPPHAAFDFTALVPLQLQTLLEGPPDRLARLNVARAILVGGAPVSAKLAQDLQAVGAPIYHTYGMTETATHVALRRLNGAQPEECFTLLPGVQARLDARGCLALRGPMIEDGWLQTNDLVELESDGRFRWLGRADLVVNTGGVKVAVEPLEEELAQLLPELGGTWWMGRRSFVGGLPDARLGQLLVLVVEDEAVAEADAETLLAALRERLGPYRAPRRLLTAPHFALTPTGKLDRPATLAAALAR